jgi:peptide/nickel transport system substrate-binding protein
MMALELARGSVPGRIVATLAAGMLMLAACSPAGQATPTSSAAASTSAPAPSSAPVGTSAPATSVPAAASGAQSGSATAPALPGPTIAPAAGQPKSGGRVIWGDFADVKTLNPVTSTDASSAEVINRIYTSLLSVDAQTGDVTPNLAEKFDFSADGKTLTFQLRDGLKFSDGSPLTGDDFKFTIMATLRSKKTNHKNNVDQIVGAKDYIAGTAEDLSGVTVTGKTITVTLINSFCPALTQVGGLNIIPKSVFGKYFDAKDPTRNLDDAPENNAPPIAGGAFKFKEWVPNDHVTLVRNDNYWQKANIEEWVHKTYPNQDALTAALKVGEVDITEFDPKDMQDMQSVSSVQVFKYLRLGYTFIGWNQLRGGKEFFQDKAVRQALTYALNVDQVVEKVLFGEGVKMIAHTPPVSWAYDTTGLNDYKYDPARAEQLLQADGWAKGSDGIYAKDGQKLEFSIITNSGNVIRETFIQIAAEQYKQIGINVEPKTESFEALVDRLNQSKDPTYGDQGGHDYDAIVIGWALGADPDLYSIWDSNSTHAGENNSIQYKNPELDKAIDDSRMHCAQADRKAAIKTANKILNEEQPYNFGFASNILLGVNKKIQNINPGPYARYGQAKPETWWIQ